MLTCQEHSECVTEMQNIWRNELKSLETTALQAVINGDNNSITNAKERANKYREIKATVDRCIDILTKYVKGSKDA
jgi:hypothetical protein